MLATLTIDPPSPCPIITGAAAATPASTTSAPARARPTAMPCPMPAPPPVTRATRPSRPRRPSTPGAPSAGRGEEVRPQAVGGLGAGAGPRDGPVVEHRHPVAEPQGVAHVLLDDEERRAAAAQSPERPVELLDDDRGQPE